MIRNPGLDVPTRGRPGRGQGARGRVGPWRWIGLALFVVCGGATVLAHSGAFIKGEPPVLYWLIGGALIAGPLFFGRNFLKSLLGSQVTLHEAGWRAMNWSWSAFFVVMGVINLWVAYTFDTDTWVNFKLFGGIGLMLVFVLAQGLYLARYMKSDDADEAADPTKPQP